MKKGFDAVGFQRKVRAKLSEEYLADREAFLEDLKRLRRETRKTM